ncbi:alginate O-acetyltransferase AlgX-related protein [Ulvibacterium marinum]|uniref:AlgX/AlgJ SGNH hydrolase-like domain-containing protein n=1 Tax=Ulvibacterium marinum TaxID=2419782 RepID=A0A3B0CFZ9_9FLAO|nr:hypothetical protein [Ulvibacterium marinum]RKN82777.1 hypothetical protein D7Z94_02745 [Ulvibacterium marinum]
MKKITLYSILFCFLFVILFVFNAKYIVINYQPKKLKVYIEVISTEEDIFQLYYREVDGKLNESLSQKIKIEASEEVQKLKFDIPDSLNVSHFRFDYGNRGRKSDVLINEITFAYNGNKEIISSNLITEFFRINRYSEKRENRFSRKTIEGLSNPFLLSRDLEKLINCLKEKPNYSRVTLNILLSAVLAFSVIIALLFYSKKKSILVSIDFIFVFAFMLLLILPHMDEYFNLDTIAISEKRDLQKKPELTVENYDEYPKEFENYYNDNFGFRKRMVSIGAMLKIKLFNSTPNSNNVIVGNEDWLFYWKSDIIKNSYLNKNPFSKEDLGTYGNSILEMKNFCLQKNKFFLATVYPNKHTIYEDKIPKRIGKIKKDTNERINQFYAFLNKNKVLNVDHRDTLMASKDNHQLYLKNDSHWNANGAYYAYFHILKMISEYDSMISPPLPRKEFKLIEVENYKGGDLLPILGIDNSFEFFTDTYIKHPPREPHFKSTESAYGKGTLLIENLKSDNLKTAVFFGDSYSKELIKFIPLHFRKTVLISSIQLKKAWLEDINPDIIVYGIVERNLENFE